MEQEHADIYRFRSQFGGKCVAAISIDTEQIWGYMDVCDEQRFSRRYPDVQPFCGRLLQALSSYGIAASWAVVGGLTLNGSSGASDARFGGLPRHWIENIPAGDEMSHPLWYKRSFFRELRSVEPRQDIGLHGGLTHLIWDDPQASVAQVERELAAGMDALSEIGISARCFVYPRNRERFHNMLLDHQVLCYRGRPPVYWEGSTRRIPRALLRAIEEIGCSIPPVVWPTERLPGLWNIPSSLSLYPMRRLRSSIIPNSTRLRRFRLGIEAAVAAGGIFHFCLHPDNLAESPRALPVFESMLEELVRWRDIGEVEILTMTEIADRMMSAGEGGERHVAVSRA